MKKQKLTLQSLKVKSFVTGMNQNQSTIKGGGGDFSTAFTTSSSLTTSGSGTAMTANCTHDPCGPFHDQ